MKSVIFLAALVAACGTEPAQEAATATKNSLAAPAVQAQTATESDTGAQGAQGVQGPKGEKGDKGDKGDAGAVGAAGADGAAGAAGVSGAAGQDGAKGDQGDRGANGADGAAGAVGAAGAAGMDGAQGVAGAAGAAGVNGADGSNGTNGSNGSNGTNGADGVDGAAGAAGATGAPGEIGIYTAANTFVGYLIDFGSSVTVMLQDGSYFNTNFGTGSWDYAPVFVPNVMQGGTCAFTSTSCSGSCYISVSNSGVPSYIPTNTLFYAGPVSNTTWRIEGDETVQGSQTYLSYYSGGQCTNATWTATGMVKAKHAASLPSGLTFPLGHLHIAPIQ